MTNKTYDVLKFIASTGLPAIITLWITLGTIWTFPLVEAVAGTLGAINVFIGALIGISSHQYKKENQ